MTDEPQGLIERLLRKAKRAPVFGGGSLSSDGKVSSYVSDDGMRLVNPDGPEAADALEKLLDTRPEPATRKQVEAEIVAILNRIVDDENARADANKGTTLGSCARYAALAIKQDAIDTIIRGDHRRQGDD